MLPKNETHIPETDGTFNVRLTASGEKDDCEVRLQWSDTHPIMEITCLSGETPRLGDWYREIIRLSTEPKDLGAFCLGGVKSPIRTSYVMGNFFDAPYDLLVEGDASLTEIKLNPDLIY